MAGTGTDRTASIYTHTAALSHDTHSLTSVGAGAGAVVECICRTRSKLSSYPSSPDVIKQHSSQSACQDLALNLIEARLMRDGA